MIPGLGHMILLGHILKELENDPELTIVLDSPASGHALTMFESSSNFQKIFKTGLIVKDIERMKSFLEDPKFLKTFIVSLPNEMAINEASELSEDLGVLYDETEIIINNSFHQFCKLKLINGEELPPFLKLKDQYEIESINSYFSLPMISDNKFEQIVNELVPLLVDLK